MKLKADKEIRRVVMCSGKVYYDLFEEREKREINDVYLLRIEQLYPFPVASLMKELARFPKPTWSGARKSRATWARGHFVDPNIEKTLEEARRRSTSAPAMPAVQRAASHGDGFDVANT